MDASRLDALEHDSDGQRSWWDENKVDLTSSEKDDVFEYIATQNPIGYRELILEMTVDRIEEPDKFLNDLHRLAPYLDQDGAWVLLYNKIRDEIDGNEAVARDIYGRLKVVREDWAPTFTRLFLAELPRDDAEAEIVDLLTSGDDLPIATGCISLAEAFEGESVSEDIIDELERLGTNGTMLSPVLKANRALFHENPGLWELTFEIGYANPEYIEQIIWLFGNEISDQHLSEYLELVKEGVEAGMVDDIQNHNLSSNFADRTQKLADFTVWLAQHQSDTAQRLAKDTAKENEAFLPALFDRADRFANSFVGKHVLRHAGEPDPVALVNELVNHYDASQRVMYLHLLRETIGELYFADSYHQHCAQDIGHFVEDTVNHHSFIDDIDWELLNTSPDGDDPNELQQRVYVHLYNIVSQILNRRDYDTSVLQELASYGNLDAQFRSRLSANLQSKIYHPLMSRLDADRDDPLLELLNDRWQQIPDPKQRALEAASSFDAILSEVLLLLWLEQRGVDYDIEVNLHAYGSGEELDRDADLRIDDTYIEILTPEMWKDLRLSNTAMGIPNRSIDKIVSKFRDKFQNTQEPNDYPVFIAMNLDQSEMMAEEVVSAMFGQLNIAFNVDEQTGALVDEQPMRDPDESIQDEHWFPETMLNGVIWYTTRVGFRDGSPKLSVDGDVIPNPNADTSDNEATCAGLNTTLFD